MLLTCMRTQTLIRTYIIERTPVSFSPFTPTAPVRTSCCTSTLNTHTPPAPRAVSMMTTTMLMMIGGAFAQYGARVPLARCSRMHATFFRPPTKKGERAAAPLSLFSFSSFSLSLWDDTCHLSPPAVWARAALPQAIFFSRTRYFLICKRGHEDDWTRR